MMMKTAERILAAYAEAEPWKADHDIAMRCFEVEEVIALGDLVYKLITYVDAAWQDRVAAGKLPYREVEDRQISERYEAWAKITERNLDEIGKLTRAGYEVKGRAKFLTQLEEARSLLESRALEADMLPIEEISPLAKGNPRPERYGA